MIERVVIPIEGYPDLVRDVKTNAIININKDKADQRLQARELRLQEKREFEQVKSDVQDIKAMLQKLLENGSHG
tara:strand:+ start:1340 stop:1561 length:222 start_codon:yes stop_codon:yes gene_type:complete